MSDVTYIFGDVLTGAIIAEIPLYGVSMTRGLGQGDFRGSFQLDQTGQENADLIAATETGRCYIVCEQEGQPIWDGFIASNTYQSQAKSCQLYALSWEMYPQYRYMRSDFTRTDQEQRNIFLDLWADLQATSGTPQIELPSSYSTVVTKSLEVKAFEFKKYRAVMDTVSAGVDGFDWTIDTVRTEGAYRRTLRIGYPTLGATAPIYFEYPGNILNYWQNVTLSERGTNIFGLGAGEGSTMLSQEVIHSDLLAGGFPRYDISFSLKGINDPTLLTSLTTQIASVRRTSTPVLTVELKSDRDPAFGGYGLGDACQLHINDARHPNLTDRIFNTRIVGWEFYPASSDKVSQVRMVFQGEDL
jgi:hypothetical protein